MRDESMADTDQLLLHPSSFILHPSSFPLPLIFPFFFRALGDNLSALQPKMGSSAGHHIMSQPSVSSWQIVRRCALACAALWLAAGSFASARVIKAHAGDDVGAGSNLSDAAPKWLVVRLRSFVPGASGRVVVEPTTSGGRVRLTAARLPVPDSVAPNAHAYIVWATGGQVRRLGELRRDARGNAEFEFVHPGGFQSYSVVVTAETDASAERPMGSPVFSTRAGEVSALYPTKTEPRAEENAGESAVRARTVTRGGTKEAAKETAKPRAKSNAATPNTMPTPTPNAATSTARVKTTPPRIAPKSDAPATATTPRAPSTSARASSAPNAAEFYESIDTAVEDTSVARTLTLAGEDGARAATGDARVATRDGTAYVRVRFRRVPSPSRFGVRKYVMWAQPTADAPLFLRALPARGLNRRTTYARRRNVGSTDFQLLVTAERSYPHPRPRGRRVMTTK
jgi:hypothetical protein